VTATLRDYQAEMIQSARDALRRVPRVLLQAPTGAGKTVLASFMVGQSTSRALSCWFICHRAELIEGTSKTFHKFGQPHGIIAAGHPMNLQALAQICSIDTLKNRLDQLKPPKLAIVDECHHCSAAGWALVIEWLTKHGAKIVGLSATPKRLDGQGLDAHFDEIVLGPSVAWLMEEGHLADYMAFCPPAPKELKARGKDDGCGAQAKVMDKPKLTGDIVQHWLKRARGMRTVGFACNVKHSQHMVEAFRAAGIPAAHLDGGTPAGERRRIIQDFAEGRILVLWNVSLFGEGFDLAAIAQRDVTVDCVILARKTASLSLFLQMIGRGLRPNGELVKVILDHADNVRTHGYPDDEREWELKGRTKNGAANDNGPPPPVICTGCFNAIRRPLPPACPHCGKQLEAATSGEIKVAEGELQADMEVERRREERLAAQEERKRRVREEVDAKTLDELVRLGKARGYKFPMKWAQHKFGARAAKQRTAAA
jgi:DNA repair protein RadD